MRKGDGIMGLRVFFGSGRAKCRECKQPIGKTDIDVMFFGYQMERHHHFKCIEKQVDQVIKNVSFK